MAFCASGGCAVPRRLLNTAVFTVLLLAVGWAAAEEQAEASAKSPPVTLRTVITGTCHEIQHYVESLVGTSVVRSVIESAVLFLESVFGQENIYTLAMFLETVIRFLAEGAASGLNVIVVYVTEILRVTGFDATLPPVTPEAVTAVAQWGLLTLIGYWILAIVLRLLIGVVRQVFWIIKTVLALWFFGLIVLDKTATADTTAVRLTGLVLVCVLLTLLTSGSEKTSAVEQRISSLEGRLKAVEKSKGD
ncbi:uncharacterized protein LOC117377753 isoform X1 [Periophthalmus magnuspinnatus]|uniref:uncharacterized protein LOC117377753 isoform X1 n=1 Tax=Periophthalmus magnuspinnatus TaxID=409849 RepID=UPI00145B5A54|nr:uncharacterized protein LOC117377753 isoform X1 [Periophthalmus magnuspinnatus]